MNAPPKKCIWKWFVQTRVGRSIFRVGLPESKLERSQAMVSSFVLHMQPAKVHRHSLKASYSLGLGLISLYLLMILVGTGTLLMFYYVPSTERAYNTMKDLQFVISAGLVLRNMHRWAAHLMVFFVILHMCRVFYTGAYKRPREFNWVIGVMLFLITLGLSFTGYLLPWDQLAFWAITVGANIAAYAPVVGPKLQYLLLGGHTVGQEALTRFYALHMIVLPAITFFLVSVHLWRVRKDGGLSRPGEAGDVVERMGLSELPTNKSYGLMELARGSTPQVGKNPDEEVSSWPHLIFRELLLFLVVVAALLVLSIFFNAPLEEFANPIHPPNPAKAPWYFLGLQELVSYSAFWGGVVVPGLLVLVLVALPYFDRQLYGVGRWFAHERRLANSIFTFCLIVAVVLTLIGTYFRGPNWSWQVPWKTPPVSHESH
ncbi:MAG: cytochrome b N-terminal domain-containing protein [Verrucomicrobiota bacterium]